MVFLGTGFGTVESLTMIAQLDPLYIRTRPSKAVSRVLSHLFFQGRFLTTRYRGLNRFILTGLAGLKRLPALRWVEKPIFIVGIGRSGTTVLGKVLSMHRDIGFLNEPKAIWYTIHSKDDVNGHFSSGPALYRLQAEDVTPSVYRTAHRIFGAYLAITRSKRVLDKNPEIIFRIPYVQAFFPDAKFVLLVRNGWDTISSIATWSRRYRKKVGGNIEDWWGFNRRKWRFMLEELVAAEPLLTSGYEEIESFTRQEDMAAVEWVVTMQEGLRWLRLLPGCMHLIRYEELTTRPEDTLTELSSFCELEQDAVFLAYARQVLKPVPHKQSQALSPAVQGAFLETMAALNYPTMQ